MKIATIMAIALINGAFVALPVSSASAQSTITVEANKPDKKSCRRESVVGSNFPKRVCLTREQWKARDRAQAEYKSKVQQGEDSRATQMDLQIKEAPGGG